MCPYKPVLIAPAQSVSSSGAAATDACRLHHDLRITLLVADTQDGLRLSDLDQGIEAADQKMREASQESSGPGSSGWELVRTSHHDEKLALPASGTTLPFVRFPTSPFSTRRGSDLTASNAFRG